MAPVMHLCISRVEPLKLLRRALIRRAFPGDMYWCPGRGVSETEPLVCQHKHWSLCEGVLLGRSNFLFDIFLRRAFSDVVSDPGRSSSE